MSRKKKKAAPDQGKAASQTSQQRADSTAISSRSTAAAAQRDKVLALLRRGPKTTLDLRQHGILSPAARVWELRHDHGHTIACDLVTLYDDEGYRHSKCASYHLAEPNASGVAQ